jgi:PDZ domain-containing protein
VAPGTTIDDLLLRVAAQGSPLPAYPVADQGELVGLISLQRAGSIPTADRASRTVAEAMTPRERVAVLSPDTPMRQALGAIQASEEPAVVTEGGRIAGLVSILDVARVLQAHLGPVQPQLRRRRRRLAGGVGALAALVVLGVVWHPPVYILSPGPASDVSHDMTITGVPVRSPSAPYLLTTVRADQHTALLDVVEMFRPHRAMVTTADVGSIAFQDLLFEESRVLAAAAAARARGIPVTLTGAGVQVIGIMAGSPAEGALRTGDLITAVDGTPVRTEFDLQDAVRSKPAGTRFGLAVERNGKSLAVTTSSGQGRDGPVLGIIPVTKKIDVAAPFRITFVHRDIGGPSAGLAYALAIADALSTTGPSRTGVVAATGTIDHTGTVGDVSGVDLKGVGARRQGANLFIVPAGEVAAARGTVSNVKGVASLSDALALLSGAP